MIILLQLLISGATEYLSVSCLRTWSSLSVHPRGPTVHPLVLLSVVRTCDAEPILESILLHCKHPSNDASHRGQREQGVADGLGDGADGGVGAPVVHYHVRVQVGVLKHNGHRAVPHEDPSFHLAINSLWGTWARNKGRSQTFTGMAGLDWMVLGIWSLWLPDL